MTASSGDPDFTQHTPLPGGTPGVKPPQTQAGSADEGDTIRLPPGRPRRSARGRRLWPAIAGAAAGSLVAALAAVWLLRPTPEAPPLPAPPPPVAAPGVVATVAPAVAPQASPYRITVADEPAILTNAEGDPAIFRFAGNPAVLVLDFGSLHAQGAMLNRVAALVEKAGLPRDRVLDDAALDQAIHASGSTADTYYYGHDYRAADLARFFTVAARDSITLTSQERWLRGLVEDQGWMAPQAVGALISLPRAGSDASLDSAGLATILRHELSHGEYFTSPAYAAWTREFWQKILSPHDRDMFRHFLAGEGYDASQEDLMMNETQAYLMHTADQRFFNSAALGATPGQVTALRQLFFQGMPTGWLRDRTTVPQEADMPLRPAAAVAPATVPGTHPRRRCQGFRSVSTSSTAPERRTPRLRAESIAACNSGK